MRYCVAHFDGLPLGLPVGSTAQRCSGSSVGAV